ncbi:uncharacterized protein BDW47DRAFT_128270 [Aspergillus candidus]|uniref:Uncharacterized protein n=1 Tax=Aspergillus candidus TaxID=41067 RepID=A0A2I2F3W4_ASPCN|nr:hypothetical protein BDW47DRAFT_128270 [Aspergillus candidus]PLB35337.1 hypothetical protein BDW47DRAFT_128270 [Aspergillus candidus]
MKIAVALSTALAVTVSAFDKNIPWGKRDYPCVNVFQGIPDNSTVSPGAKIDIKFNRAPTTHCDDSLAKYKGGAYSVWLYNNLSRDRDNINFDERVKVQGDIAESDGAVTITIPNDLPAVDDKTVWYLRLDTTLINAPQMPSLFNAAGPFTIN